jgi:glycosyltransferase involved in cell wall biosynthesis
MKQKRVLYLITKATWGGAQRYVFDLATNAKRQGYEVSVAYGNWGKLARDLERSGIEMVPIASLGRNISLLSDIQSFYAIWRCIRETRPDVVHVNSSKAAALGALAARLIGVRHIIFTAHGWPFKENRSVIWKSVIYCISWFTAVLSHETIVVSKSDEVIGKKMLVAGKKVRYVPLGIVPPEFLDSETAAAKLSLSPSPWPKVVTIAELTPNKGIRFAVEAVALLKKSGTNVSYFIAGDGENHSALTERAKVLDVADRVHFLGFIPDAATYLHAFDMCLLPSIKEGMPYVLLEAAYADLPIVATSVIDPGFFEKYPLVTKVDPANPEALAHAIQSAIGTHPNYQEYPTLEAMVADTFQSFPSPN